MKNIALKAIELYQTTISKNRPPCCRFMPTCSEYAKTAIQRYGTVQGTVLALKRLSRCHPYGKSGYDPVPERRDAVIRRDENQ